MLRRSARTRARSWIPAIGEQIVVNAPLGSNSLVQGFVADSIPLVHVKLTRLDPLIHLSSMPHFERGSDLLRFAGSYHCQLGLPNS